jgi:hypothetical protein
MSHNISSTLIEQMVKGPSATKITQVANLQTHIQDIFGSGYHSFLQGSYKNDTAILDINDVDIMVIRLKTYSSQHSPLARPENSVIQWNTIFSEIEEKLKSQNRYRLAIQRGNKCITVTTVDFKADIVPAAQIGNDYTVDPIAIYSFRDGLEKVNYPRTHYDNGVEKNRTTDGNYKFLVRMFKNWSKNHFDNKDILSSYKIESLVYGVDNSMFSNDYAMSFIQVATEIYKKLISSESSSIILSVCGYENILDNWGLRYRQMVVSQLNTSIDLMVKAYMADNSLVANNLFKRAFNF